MATRAKTWARVGMFGFLSAVIVGCAGAVDSVATGPDGSAEASPPAVPPTPAADAGSPDASDGAAADAPSDAPGDASADATVDAPGDASTDATTDATADASADAPGDASLDATVDAAPATMVAVDPSLVGVNLPITLNCTGRTTGNPSSSVPVSTYSGPFTVSAQFLIEYAPGTGHVWRASIVRASHSTDVRAAMGWTDIFDCGSSLLSVSQARVTTWTTSTIRSSSPGPCTANFTLTMTSPDHFTVSGASHLGHKQRITGITYTNDVSCTGSY